MLKYFVYIVNISFIKRLSLKTGLSCCTMCIRIWFSIWIFILITKEKLESDESDSCLFSSLHKPYSIFDENNPVPFLFTKFTKFVRTSKFHATLSNNDYPSTLVIFVSNLDNIKYTHLRSTTVFIRIVTKIKKDGRIFWRYS